MNVAFTCIATAALHLVTLGCEHSSHNRLAPLYGNQPSARRQPSTAQQVESSQGSPVKLLEIKVGAHVQQEEA